MTFEAQETSDYGGKPLELFLFRAGPSLEWTYTSIAEEQTFLGRTYSPIPISRSEWSQAGSDQSKTFEVTVPKDASIVDQFLAYLPVRPMQITVYRKHMLDLDEEYAPFFIGSVVSCVINEDDMATLTCRPIGGHLQRRVPWPTYQATCNWALYGTGCGADREAFRTDGTVIGVNGLVVSAAAFDGFDDGWFTAGYVIREATQEIRFITNHVDTDITLSAAFPNLQGGEILKAYAGCDRLEATCIAKFDNQVRFLGFPRIPTKNPFRDNIFGATAPTEV